MAEGEDPTSLSGTLVTVPFQEREYIEKISSEYRQLAEEFGPDRVLALIRYPGGIDQIEEQLAATTDTLERPNLVTLADHAQRVLEEGDEMPNLVSKNERTVLIREFLTDYSWEHPDLQKAAQKEGFLKDFIRFLVTASYQLRPESIDDELLAEVYKAIDDFHKYSTSEITDAEGYSFLDQSNLIVRAIEQLDDPEVATRIRTNFDAVLAVEFEEFDPTSRIYLKKLCRDHRLVAIARTDSSIRRPWSESGRIENVVTMEPRPEGNDSVTDPLGALSSFFVTGDAQPTDLSGNVSIIEEETFRAHIEAIGNEIESLHNVEEIAYDDIAVVLRDANAPIERTNDILRARGLPTTSTTVRGLEHDPVARELLAVTRIINADEDSRDRFPSERVSKAKRTLETRLEMWIGDDATNRVEAALSAVRRAETPSDGLWRWIVRTNLKERIVADTDPVEARIQNSHVKEIVTLTKFVSQDVISGGWDRLEQELENLFEGELVDRFSENLDTIDGAIKVDPARSLKHLDMEVVFLVGVVEDEYPAEPQFGSLFSQAQLRSFPVYPTVVSPTHDDVRDTYESANVDYRTTKDPLQAYYGHLSRRILGLAVRTASERVYFGVYREDDSLGRRRRPSRFISAAESQFGEFNRVDHETVATRGPDTYALTRVEHSIDRLQQAAIRDEPVDLAALEEEFGVVQSVLDSWESEEPELRQAIQTQIDRYKGEILRE